MANDGDHEAGKMMQMRCWDAGLIDQKILAFLGNPLLWGCWTKAFYFTTEIRKAGKKDV